MEQFPRRAAFGPHCEPQPSTTPYLSYLTSGPWIAALRVTQSVRTARAIASSQAHGDQHIAAPAAATPSLRHCFASRTEAHGATPARLSRRAIIGSARAQRIKQARRCYGGGRRLATMSKHLHTYTRATPSPTRIHTPEPLHDATPNPRAAPGCLRASEHSPAGARPRSLRGPMADAPECIDGA